MPTTTPHALRPELTRPLPDRIAALPIDARGYPVPWFVAWLDAETPEFRAMDRAKWTRAVRDKLCWICGQPLGRYLSFVIGPMCGVNRTTSEPPCHLDCAVWSAVNCPFLARPHMVRRDQSDLDVGKPAGFMLDRNPGVTLVWTTRTYEVFRAETVTGATNPGYLITIGEPDHVRWYSAGRPATRAEVQASIASGLPALESMCDQDRRPTEARRVLAQYIARIDRLLPAA